VTEPVEFQDRVAPELLPGTPAAPLESILRLEEFRKRPSRPPDHEKENSALVALSGALADSPRTILQTLADKVLDVLDADSAGLSLLTKDGERFYWAAIAGAWGPHIGGGTPRDFGPCGDVLDRNIPMLFSHWERRYPYLSVATPLADEGLLAPFYVNGRAVGTIWAIAHNELRKFDAEDQRLLESMGRFASAAYQVVESIDSLWRVIEAADSARERLTRDIHDGAQQQFVDSFINLQRAQEKWSTDPERARELLDLAAAESEAGIETLRELAAGIHPTILNDRGLAAALKALAARAPIPVSLEIDDLELPPSLDVSAYFFCSEALTNVAKHASASSASVRAETVGGQLTIEVRDDGSGGAAIGSGGSGLLGLSDRIKALEGSIELNSPRGGPGTTLIARIPLPAG